MGGWFRKEIKSIADLRGLRFRIPGLAGRILATIGVVPQQIAPGAGCGSPRTATTLMFTKGPGIDLWQDCHILSVFRIKFVRPPVAGGRVVLCSPSFNTTHGDRHDDSTQGASILVISGPRARFPVWPFQFVFSPK